MHLDVTIPMWSVWLTLTILLGIIEIFSTTAIAICLAMATTAALLATLLGASVQAQLLIMAVAAVLSLIFIAPLFRRLLHGSAPSAREAASNMDALIGTEVTLAHGLAPDKLTRVRINGDNWQVRAAAPDVELPAGYRATVCGYDSIILLVK